MPTLLRFALGAIQLVLIAASAAVPALLGPDLDADPVRFTVWTFALTAVAIPGLMGGLYLSYWSWSGQDARRRLRRLLLVLVGIQLVGAVALLFAAAVSPAWLLGTAVVVVVGLALDPVTAAIGRAARRIEERRPATATRVPPELDREIRSGWRRGGIGAAIGLAVGVLLIGGLSLLLDPGETLLGATTIGIVASMVLLGAAIGMLTKSLTLSRRIRDELGGDFSTARRIGRAVAGKGETLTPEDEDAAARYAAIVSRWQPFQLTASLLILVAVGVQQVGNLLEDGGRLDQVRWITLGVLALALVVLLPLTVVRMRRLRAYAVAHPV